MEALVEAAHVPMETVLETLAVILWISLKEMTLVEDHILETPKKKKAVVEVVATVQPVKIPGTTREQEMVETA
jgi:hypothetical protein